MTGLAAGVPLVEVTRRDVRSGGQLVESLHAGHVVVADADGVVHGALGVADLPVFVRSAVKPLQATACLELLADADQPPPAPRELAVAWASHRGEPRHLQAVEALLQRAGVAPEQLTCPPAVGHADPDAAPTRLQHNCSGKHALFAVAGGTLGLTGSALLDPDAPLQRAVLATLEVELGYLAGVGVDGCGAPAAVGPLDGLAASFARLASEPRFAPVREAGFAYPGLVGGEGRLESALLARGVVAKPGAEGVFAVGWDGGQWGPLGLAVKITDGEARGARAVVAALLAHLEVVPADTWSPPPPLGGGQPAGVVRVTAAVEQLARRVERSADATG
ncbi:MAG: asparaginase [Actinomycetota bacterium]